MHIEMHTFNRSFIKLSRKDGCIWESARSLHVPCVPEIVLQVRDIINRVIQKLECRTRDHLKAEIWRK